MTSTGGSRRVSFNPASDSDRTERTVFTHGSATEAQFSEDDGSAEAKSAISDDSFSVASNSEVTDSENVEEKNPIKKKEKKLKKEKLRPSKDLVRPPSIDGARVTVDHELADRDLMAALYRLSQDKKDGSDSDASAKKKAIATKRGSYDDYDPGTLVPKLKEKTSTKEWVDTLISTNLNDIPQTKSAKKEDEQISALTLKRAAECKQWFEEKYKKIFDSLANGSYNPLEEERRHRREAKIKREHEMRLAIEQERKRKHELEKKKKIEMEQEKVFST
eukprot:TRINITY_DN187_c2_g2_i5.p1 TRINITY_DN187_c2_g2~~TRINITY_DN187_c2_g2_i5.p1  ORF type:complete len:276 (+),score=84.24 TRINITY_DN187_c2_g2_i5:2-829(+)